jgi:hypothetical protein
MSFQPVGYIPSSVRVSPDGNYLYVTNMKGEVSGPNLTTEFIGGLIRSTVSMLSTPTDDKLKELTQKVKDNNNAAVNYYTKMCDLTSNPIPTMEGDRSSPIKHVIYVVRENKTYDALLGDMGGDTNGDSSLTLFGEKCTPSKDKNCTPNLHALAREFVSFDNFYNEAEQSLQGHMWIAGGMINDFSERMWMGMWCRGKEAQLILPSVEPASKTESGTVFDHLYNNGVDFRIYGEVTGVLGDIVGKYREQINLKFPSGANMEIKDVDRAKEFIREMNAGIFPAFIYIWLPDDHTYGTGSGKPKPESMVAENDEATGLLVDAVSKSPHWKDTAVFIFEDDPQSTPDHVDAHRTILVIASPWVKKGYTSHVHHSLPSIHRTMTLLLGVPPMTRYEKLSAPFYDAFTDSPNYATYTYRKSEIKYEYNPEGAPMQAESNKLDFSDVDKAPGLGKILWNYMKGPDVPFPAQLADDD